MRIDVPTDYDTYQEIMDELLHPISQQGLDFETLKSLYESKLVYLQNLRVKCFKEINSPEDGFFSTEDYTLILDALRETRVHLKNLVIFAVNQSLKARY